MDDATTGVLVIRVWRDRGRGSPLKARVTSVLDLSSHESREITCSGADQVRAAVTAWLDDFEAVTAAPSPPA